MASYLVTGCAGFIGSYLVSALVERGDVVIGVDAFSDYYARALKESNLLLTRGHERFTFEMRDLATDDLDPVVADEDGIFHLAAQPGVRGSWGETFALYARD